MSDKLTQHVSKLPIGAIAESIHANPQVACSTQEVIDTLQDLRQSVEDRSYIPATPTSENPALSDSYIFTVEDGEAILQDLSVEHFVAKIQDLGKGAKKRMERGLPQEYLYVFQYPCRLYARELGAQPEQEDVLIYIKINNRKVPYKKVFVISFHKNR